MAILLTAVSMVTCRGDQTNCRTSRSYFRHSSRRKSDSEVLSKLHLFLILGRVGPILAQREAYVDLRCSCQIGDAYIDLSIHLFDSYTRSEVNAAPPLNPNPTLRDDRTRNPPNRSHSHLPLTNAVIINALHGCPIKSRVTNMPPQLPHHILDWFLRSSNGD